MVVASDFTIACCPMTSPSVCGRYFVIKLPVILIHTVLNFDDSIPLVVSVFADFLHIDPVAADAHFNFDGDNICPREGNCDQCVHNDLCTPLDLFLRPQEGKIVMYH